MPDPVAWLVVEAGWDVVGSGDADLGRVKDVFGDENADIFDGLLVTRGVGRGDHYVPAERITGIFEGRVETDLTEDLLDGLEREAPGSVRALVR